MSQPYLADGRERDANYDPDSLYCEECGAYWSDCECMSLASEMEWWERAEDAAESLEEEEQK